MWQNLVSKISNVECIHTKLKLKHPKCILVLESGHTSSIKFQGNVIRTPKVILHWSSLFLGVWGNNEVLTLECMMKSGSANYISLHILTIYNISVHSSHGQQNKQNEKTLSWAPEDNHEGRIAKEVWLRGFVMAIWRSKGLGDFTALNFMVLNFNRKELFLGGSLQIHHICTSTITWHNSQFSFA